MNSTIDTLTIEEARTERERILGFASLSTADWVRERLLRRHIDRLETPVLELERELVDAIDARDAVLEKLTPFNASIDGDGTYAQLYRGRHEQLLRRLEDAERRVWSAQDAINAATAASVA